MPKKGYNYNFKMMMEGIEVPFQSANIVCTPNGVEGSINVHANEKLLELKPKTAIQIFYQDWFGKDAPGWHLLFDGFFSRYDKNEDASGGIGIALQARDFRMDIRKCPAALSYNDAGDISGATYYHTAGLFKTVTYKTDMGKFSTATRTFDNSRLNDLADRVVMIANTASGGLAIQKGVARRTNTGSYYDSISETLPQAVPQTKNKDPKKKDYPNIQGNANGGFFLDAFVRGIWLDAAGGTKLGTFLNKRIRVDKRFMVARNEAGYDMFRATQLGQLAGEAATADSQFSSIETMIMRIAALFMTRTFSCNTPNLISLADNSDAVEYVIDQDVRNFCVKMASKEFGPPYMLNSSMLLPPLEFTAPPDCNLIFPCMYHRIIWQYDMDAEITRGYFTATDCFHTESSPLSLKWGYQVPNGLFYVPKKDAQGKSSKAIPEYKSSRLTLEERYKGVNVMEGTVEEMVAYREMSRHFAHAVLNQDAEKKWEADNAKYLNYIMSGSDPKKDPKYSAAQLAKLKKSSEAYTSAIQKNLKTYIDDKASKKSATNVKEKSPLSNILKHHALLKFINTRYAGRVVTVEMAFNPYIICGFPAIVIADDHGDGFKTLKTMIGMVQQVKHYITRDGEAVSSAVINDIRFIEEPTDMDENGNPLYCTKTDSLMAKLDPKTLKYVYNLYYVGMKSDSDISGIKPDAKPKIKAEFVSSENLDIVYNSQDEMKGYIYAKDLLAISQDDANSGKINGIYLDDVYAPNKITAFYKAVFGQKSNFMVGTGYSVTGNPYPFMYDSIHEAVENLTTNPKLRPMLSDYEKAMSYIKRDVCCEEGFYCGILGLSVKDTSKTGPPYFLMKTGLNTFDKFDPTASHPEYYGVSTNKWDSLPNEIKTTTIKKPGTCSSIIESSPVTALIEERKDAVHDYLKSILDQAEAVSFSQ